MEPLSSSLVIKTVLFIITVSACALFSFLETAVTSLRLFNLKQLARTISGYDDLFHALETKPQQVLIAILIANNLASVTSAAVITQVMKQLFIQLNWSEGLGFSLGIAVATAATLIFGEIFPKNIAQSQGERFLRSTLWLVHATFFFMKPLVKVLSALSNFVLTFFKGSHGDSSQAVITETEIKFLIDHINKNGLIDTDKTQMLHSVFELEDTTVREIMVPYTDVISISVETSIQQALEIFCKYHFSRLPVYENKPDNIIGMVHQKDIFLLLSKNEQKQLHDLVRPIVFVPESMRVNQLLHQFKQQRRHIGMVLNEYGSIIGLVTLEDAIEEIVGEINDEHESASEQIVPLEQGGWLVYAAIDLDELEKFLNMKFITEDAVSLGGFLIERLQHVPRKGERLLYGNHIFQIQKATEKRIIQVIIFKEK